VSDKQRKTGLGTNAFFHPPTQPEAPPTEEETLLEPEAPAPAARRPAKKARQLPPQSERVKTTINLPSETLALLDALKINARRSRRKATYSDILDEAIRDLARKRGIKASEP